MIKRLLRRPGIRSRMTALIAAYVRFALRTTRWTIDGGDHLAPALAGAPAIIGFWHEEIALMPALWRHARRVAPSVRVTVLASRHNDGRLLGDLMQRFGVGVVHGSTARDGKQRGGAAGLRALVTLLEAGSVVIITPDGPRGPRRHAAPGIAQLAAIAAMPVLPCGAQTSRRWTLGTWDRLILPLPWGRGMLVCGPPLRVPRRGWEAFVAPIAAAMTQAANRADALCR